MVRLALHSLNAGRRTVLTQIARFLVGGVFVTALGVGLYAIFALALRWNPQLCNFLAYVLAMTTGYFMHSQWSFRGHGSERTRATRARFIMVSLIGYSLNSFWIWLLFAKLELGRAAPMIPMLLVSPAVTFVVNRQWVFR